MQTMLNAIADEGKMRVRDIQVRVNAKGYGEKATAIGLIAVEEIPVVKIAIRARKGNRFSGLMNWIVVTLRQHIVFQTDECGVANKLWRILKEVATSNRLWPKISLFASFPNNCLGLIQRISSPLPRHFLRIDHVAMMAAVVGVLQDETGAAGSGQKGEDLAQVIVKHADLPQLRIWKQTGPDLS